MTSDRVWEAQREDGPGALRARTEGEAVEPQAQSERGPLEQVHRTSQRAMGRQSREGQLGEHSAIPSWGPQGLKTWDVKGPLEDTWDRRAHPGRGAFPRESPLSTGPTVSLPVAKGMKLGIWEGE